jgi:hypothetical protein
MAMPKALLLYRTGEAGALATVADIMAWILSTGCSGDAARCGKLAQQAIDILRKIQQ